MVSSILLENSKLVKDIIHGGVIEREQESGTSGGGSIIGVSLIN